MSIPESTKAYLAAANDQRTVLLRESYRTEAAKQAGTDLDLLRWHLSRLEEYCQRLLLLSAELRKKDPMPCRALVKTDAFSCIQIASSEVNVAVVACPGSGRAVSTSARELTLLLAAVADTSRSEEVIRDSFEFAYAFSVVAKQCISIVGMADNAAYASLPLGMEKMLSHRMCQLFSHGMLLPAQLEGISVGISALRRAS